MPEQDEDEGRPLESTDGFTPDDPDWGKPPSTRAPDHPSNCSSIDNLGILFTFHLPDENQAVRYRALRLAAKDFAEAILECCSPCTDTQAAVRYVRLALMIANAAIALEEKQSEM